MNEIIGRILGRKIQHLTCRSPLLPNSHSVSQSLDLWGETTHCNATLYKKHDVYMSIEHCLCGGRGGLQAIFCLYISKWAF